MNKYDPITKMLKDKYIPKNIIDKESKSINYKIKERDLSCIDNLDVIKNISLKTEPNEYRTKLNQMGNSNNIRETSMDGAKNIYRMH